MCNLYKQVGEQTQLILGKHITHKREKTGEPEGKSLIEEPIVCWRRHRENQLI